MSEVGPAGAPLARAGPVGGWAALVAGSLLIGGMLEWARLPAALLLGPLVAAVLAQVAGMIVRVPSIAMLGAQAVIGCLVARSVTPASLTGFVAHWPLFVGAVLLSIGASAAIGWGISRLGIIPGSTAVWGMIPGAATAMVVLAEAHGADVRLVAFMQYLRVVLVALAASLVALLFVHGGGRPATPGLLAPVDWRAFAATLAVIVVGGGLGALSRISAGVLLGPLALGAALGGAGWLRIELPAPLLIASYALIGWSTGLRFTRDVLAAALRALPQTIAAALLLIAFCGLLAGVLVREMQVDPLTAYLATSPGGVDAAAIIAASARVDTPFVMALRVARVLLLLLVGPVLARWVAARARPART